MLRPATPLTILLGVAFALLLLSVLSTPIVHAIPLGSFEGVTFGVFGFCKPDGDCSSISIGYNTDSLFENNSQAFDLPSGIRNTLSAILIVHPVAALLTLCMFVMAIVAHIHSASHSTKYLLIVFIFTFITFLVCLLAFLIDVLLFVPHLAWGSYIVLAATILVAMSGVVSCAMRRTLVSRKDRQRRIDENAEMSGENFYNREAQKTTAAEIAMQPTMPVVSGATGNNDSLPTFASYEQNKGDQVSDERIPLTTRSPSNSNRSPNQANNHIPGPGEVMAFNNGPSRSASRDRFGNQVNAPREGYGVRRGPSNERMNSRGRGDMGGYPGGRGGGPPGRGGYDNFGAPMRGRGGYGPPPGRGGYGPRGGRGGYGPPPRGAYAAGGMRGGRSPPPGYNNPAAGPYDRRPSPAGAYGAYDRRPSDDPSQDYPSANPSMPSVNGGYEAYTPESASLPRAESPPPLPGTVPATMGGQAVEMDAAQRNRNGQYGQFNQLRDSDVDVAGMVGLQQGQTPGRHDTYMSDGSRYSTDEQYVPPRAGWNQGGSGRNSPMAPSPLHIQELPAGRNTPPVAAAAGGNYYEDVDPRFASTTPPGSRNQPPPPIEPIYEDIHANNPGARSPAESERSNFTSISQRGVNPRWNPGPPPPMPYQQGPNARRPVQQQQRQDMILDNPDFQLPGSRTNPQRGGPGMIPGSAYPTGPL